MAGSSIAGMIVGTVFIVIFASATVTMVDNINKAQQATEVNLPDPEINLDLATWTDGTLVLTISNVGSETISVNHIYFSLDGGTPLSIGDSSLALDSTGSLFPGETIFVTQTGVTDAPTDALLVAFEYSSSVEVT